MAFESHRYYCLICPLTEDNAFGHTVSLYGIQRHLESEHGYPPESGVRGEDWCQGFEAKRVVEVRARLAREEADRLARALSQNGYSADDFLVDCGGSS